MAKLYLSEYNERAGWISVTHIVGQMGVQNWGVWGTTIAEVVIPARYLMGRCKMHNAKFGD